MSKCDFFLFVGLLCTALSGLRAQAPVLMDGAAALRQRELAWANGPLREEGRVDTFWQGELAALSTLGAGDRWAPLSEGGGLGTAYRGAGAALAVSRQLGGWDLAGTGLFLARAGGQSQGELYTGHMTYRTEGGWRLGLEQEPMKWGYGPYGGNLLGSSSAPFPKLRVLSRVFAPELMGSTLGRWSFDWFTGQLESTRTIPTWQQSYASSAVAAKAREGYSQDYGRPYQSGLLLSAEFLGWIELQAGVTSMWGGYTRDGVDRMAGLSWAQYLLATVGGENLVAEGGSQANLDHFHATSNGIASIEVRARSQRMARWMGARGAYWYVAHGGENVRWRWRELDRHPIPAMCGATYALGTQVNWETADLAMEYRENDSSQPEWGNYQTYQNGTFLAGHSRLGDCLGFTQGGGLRMGTVALGLRPWQGGQFRVLLSAGFRRPVEALTAWQALHPGELPQHDHLYCVELSGQQALSAVWRAGLTLGIKREDHVQFANLGQTSTNLVLSVARRLGAERP